MKEKHFFLQCNFILFCLCGLNILAVENTLIFIHLFNSYKSFKTNKDKHNSVKTNRNKLACCGVCVTSDCFHAYLDGLSEEDE